MLEYALIAALAAGFYVGWNVGANDAANAMGVPVGGRIISYRKAVLIMIVFVLMGAVFEGGKVMETVGAGIVTSPQGNPLTEVPILAVVALLSAGVWVTIATKFRLPVSTSQGIVGSVFGAGLVLSFLNLPEATPISMEFSVLGRIGLAWILTPISAAFFAYIIYQVSGLGLRRITDVSTFSRILSFLIIVTGALVAYSLGANTVGNATALIYTFTKGEEVALNWSKELVGLFGGIALAVGALTYSKNVMRTVGRGITNLDAVTAFAAQLSAGSTVWIFVQFGIPVSTSQAIVGGVAGAGLVKGTAAVSKDKLSEIIAAWILTPTVSGMLTIALGWVALSLV